MTYPRHANHNQHSRKSQQIAWKKIKSDPDRLKADRLRRRGYDLMRNFGITLEQYNELLEHQNDKCGICGIDIQEVLEERTFAVDHSHTTGEVRGLLCMLCNTGLGKFKDDPDLLVKAIVWLTKSK